MLGLIRPWRHASNHVILLPCARSLTTTCLRWQAPQTKTTSQPNYSDTVHLPKTAMPMANDPSKDEVLRRRTTEDLYRWQWENAKGPLFVFHDGPPYANGDLHIGHSLNKVLKDIINRFHTSLGQRVHYFPGWDCHGLPIENKVLKELGKDLNDISPAGIRAEAEIYAKSQVQNQLAQFRELGIMADWRPESTYRTMDHDYEMRQLRIFQKMVQRGLIYRQHRPVHYSPSSRSALAEAELEYKDKHRSHAVYVAFDLDFNHKSDLSPKLLSHISNRPNTKLLTFTTTPWTLSANMGIAVNAEMDYVIIGKKEDPTGPTLIVAQERLADVESILEELGIQGHIMCTVLGQDLVGAPYRPLFHPVNPALQNVSPFHVIASNHVTPDTGTGLVHCAPAHGHEDYNVFQNAGLISASSPTDILCHVDDLGCFSLDIAEIVGEEAARDLIGKEVLGDGGKAISMLLKSMGVVLKNHSIKHRYPYDWKTDKPVIIRATSQWFANLDAIKANALSALHKVKFIPEQSRNRLESHVRQRSEWCISRQRVWGVPIPALYHLPTNRAVLDASSLDHILSVLSEKGTRHWWEGPVSDFIPSQLLIEGENVEETWKKGTDTMDVWFDSGTSWSMLEGLGQEAGKPLANVCLEGSDQHRGWFQSQLLTAIGVKKETSEGVRAPYGTLITHGMVVDANGKKMSKSLGNIISPKEVIHGSKKMKAYGVETLRLWVASVDCTGEMSIGAEILNRTEEMHRKIRNTLRYCLGSLEDQKLSHTEKIHRENMTPVSRYVMHKLYLVEQDVLKAYRAYDFPRVVALLQQFIYDTLSSFYITITKDVLYVERKDFPLRREALTVLDQVLETLVRMVAPILPHLAEEVNQVLHKDQADVPSVFTKPWTPLSDEWHDIKLERDMEAVLRLRSDVMDVLEKARRDGRIRNASSAQIDLNFYAQPGLNSASIASTLQNTYRPENLFGVSSVNIQELTEPMSDQSIDWQTLTLNIPTSDGTNRIMHTVLARARQSDYERCPRCYLHTRVAEEPVCARCTNVLRN
ncbi:hypothetical protein QCA50_013304 [Cerrena zonata]|uniref:isoleucine--tRNA ligase n=1 Tax=Cerrena zonata TaxID=2478898 RepID=A0AAW0G340_9APHY